MKPSLLRFFALTFVLAWTLWASAAMLSQSISPGRPNAHLFLPGTFAPGIVALWLTWRAEGNAGATKLLGRLFQWRVGARWYVFAVTFMAAIKLATALGYRVITGAWPAFGQDVWYVILAGTVLSTVVGGQSGEEVGWRGYALPRMAMRLGLPAASVVLGIIWALWHLPLFFVPGADTYGQSFPTWALGVTALSVAIAWLYAHTNGSLLLTMLMHSAINQALGIVSSAVPGATNTFGLSTSLLAWLTVALLWICGAYFLISMPRAPAP